MCRNEAGFISTLKPMCRNEAGFISALYRNEAGFISRLSGLFRVCPKSRTEFVIPLMFVGFIMVHFCTESTLIREDGKYIRATIFACRHLFL